MPKRSLHPGNGDTKNIEQLNLALEQMMARNDGQVGKTGPELEPLVRIAAELRNLPNAMFKARLKSELEGRKRMSTLAEPVAGVRTTASPRLAFRDAAKAIAFYQKAFGAKETFRFEVGGHIPHAEMAVGDSTIHLTEEWPEGGRFSAETLGHSPISLDVTVPDVDSFAEHAIAAGMKVLRPLKDQFYGYRDITMADPFGYSWTVGTVKESMPVEEMHRRMKGMNEGPEGGQMQNEKPVSHIRPGLRMITPYLVAENGIALIDFVKSAFGAEELFRAEMPTGVHGEVRIGDSTLMLGGGIPGRKFVGNLQPGALHMYVKDADAVYQQALKAGAKSMDEPVDHDYGERSATVQDPAGNLWYIATHKGGSYMPKGLHNVNPYLHPSRAEPLINFLKRAFGAQEITKYVSPDGVVNHVEVRVGDSILEMGEAHGKYETMPAMFYVFVPNVDAAYQQLRAAGATAFQEPTDQPYGDRNAGLRDNFGNTWYIATHTKDRLV
jgi:PhnB protein